MRKSLTRICKTFESGTVQNNANFANLEKCRKMRPVSLSEVSIQPRADRSAFALGVLRRSWGAHLLQTCGKRCGSQRGLGKCYAHLFEESDGGPRLEPSF